MSEPTISGREVLTYFAIAGGLGFLVALALGLLVNGPLQWRPIIGFGILSAIVLGGLTIANVSKRREEENAAEKTEQPSS